MLHMWLPFGVIINENYRNVVLNPDAVFLTTIPKLDDDTDTGDEDELSCLFPLLMKHCPNCLLCVVMNVCKNIVIIIQQRKLSA